ncbi:hypothetical protein OAD41_00185 [bacterium]|nr:hypothetical protein [bacterium]
MAKRFGGFTPEQMGKIIPEMAGMQSDEQAKFLAASPSSAARVGKLAEAAQKKIEMAYGGYVKGYAEGGIPEQGILDTAQQNLADSQTALSTAQQNLAANPEDPSLQAAITSAEASVAAAKAAVSGANSALGSTALPSLTEASSAAFNEPGSLMSTADVVTISDEDKTAGTITEGTGDAGVATVGTETTATQAIDVTAPEATDANTYEPVEAAEGVKGIMDRLEAVTGKPSDEALADAATMSPEDLSQLGLSVAQIEQAQTVQAPDARTVQEGELIEGSTVDMDVVKRETNFEAATGAPSSDATVQGQLTGLMEQFEGSEPPAWAAGALRGAAAAMAARGLSSSSMAGQALIQAAMEAALPIATQDANTSATFERQNLSNRQQASMFAAEQRAKFLEIDFDQSFQTRVLNASKISDIANMNFTAEVQIALENAQMAQTVDLTNLNAVNAKVLSDAAAMSQLDMTNLNNRQQAQIQNATAFLEIDMSNLANEQQTSVFKAQQNANALLSDQAAQNASAQFNATSQNQTDQFFASLSTQVAQFNTAQSNAMSQFNTGESNAMTQFNTAQQNARDQFNAQNHLVIAQANANWSQSITTAENAADNQANRDATLAENNLTMTAYNNLLQMERDIISWAWQSGENSLDRTTNLMIAKIDADNDSEDSMSSAFGGFTSRILTNLADKLF